MDKQGKPLDLPCSKEEFKKAVGNKFVPFTLGDLQIILSIDNNKWHMSVGCKNRLPKYQELKHMRYELLPDDCYMAQIFPPKKEFVNLHPFTLHLWEIDNDPGT